MPVVCESCGKDNRSSAMFCIGCTGRLPGFAPTGPSALEAMRSLRVPRRTPADGAGQKGGMGAAAFFGEAIAFWFGLAVLAAVVIAGFTSWYVYVTRKSEPSAPPAARVVQAPVPEVDLPNAGAWLLAPAATPSSSPLPLPLPHAQARAQAPVPPRSAAIAETPADAVSTFYRALSRGDGKSAAAMVTPAKRGAGPYEETGMTRFYASFREPLQLLSVRPLDARRVEARYRYRATHSRCDGTAIVDTERVAQRVVIRSIQANC
ncbi:hypothetical protein QTH87_20415 [Variovorax sp. J22P168]|uniref:hypothetical protein n=1 Tax=Variovorax jilinensis TaxID=3053513 RepID=UPI0025755005|nr:hypothetical protein [Variovorax sp. J22P168]MDM0014819.1 hypothetical protein [Variovorax sp. J22P168]